MIRRWLIALIILLACSVAAGAEKPHIVIFSTSTCSPCNRLKQDFAVSPSLTPIAQAAWVSYLPPSDSRAKAYGFTGVVPLIVVLEPTSRGTYQECYRQVGYDGDPAKLSQNLYGCGLLRRLLGRDRNQRPGPTPDGDGDGYGGDTIPIPDEGGTIPIPGETPGTTPENPQSQPVCPDYSDDIAALQARIAALENKRVILQTVTTDGRVLQTATAPLGQPIKLRLVPVSPKGQ